MPDRYADAVRARRTELRRELDRLAARPDLRAPLALARLRIAAEVSAELDALRQDIVGRLDRGDAAARRRLPGLAAAAVGAIGQETGRRWDTAACAVVRRVTADCGVLLPAGWPDLPRIDPAAAPPAPPRPVRLSEVLRDSGVWRLALLPAALLSLLGLPAGAAPALLLPAAGAGVLVGWLTIASQRAAVERQRLRRWSDDALVATRSGLDAALGRAVLEIEHSAAPQVATALARRRSALAAELRLLTAQVSDAPV